MRPGDLLGQGDRDHRDGAEDVLLCRGQHSGPGDLPGENYRESSLSFFKVDADGNGLNEMEEDEELHGVAR